MTTFCAGRGALARDRGVVAGASPPDPLGVPALADLNTSTTSHTPSYTLEPTADGLVVIVFGDGDDDISSVAWQASGAASQPLTEIRKQVAVPASNRTIAGIYALANPNFGDTSGLGTITITLASAGTLAMMPISINGWSGVAPVANGQSAVTSSTDPAALPIDPDPNSLIFDAVITAATGITFTFDGTETVLAQSSSIAGGTLAAAVAYKQVTSGAATSVDVALSGNPVRYAQATAAFPT